MTTQPGDPNHWQQIIFHSIFPSVYFGPFLEKTSGSAVPAMRPFIEAFSINEEYETIALMHLVRNFENEMVLHRQQNPTYLIEVSKRFNQAWQYENYYQDLIQIVWKKWIAKDIITIRKLEGEIHDIAFAWGEPIKDLSKSDNERVQALTSTVQVLTDRVNDYQHWINNAKAAIYLIHQTKTLFEYYLPTDTTKKTTENQSNKSKGPKREKTIEDNERNYIRFRQEVRTGIEVALKNNEEPNEKIILKTAFSATIKRFKISNDKLRKDITPAQQKEVFGKIYQEELAHKDFYIKKLL